MKTSLYIIPHQDDELFTFGVDIVKRIKNKERVIVLLVADGAKCWVKDMLHDGKQCEVAQGVWDNHNFELSESEFVASRDSEFADCCARLGINKDDIFYANPRLPDMGVSVEAGRQAIMQILVQENVDRVCAHAPRPECSFDPATRDVSMPPHIDHCFLGQACQELLEEGKIKKLEFCVEFYDVDRFKEANPKIKLTQTRPTKEELRIIQNAGVAYKTWNPEAGRYAIGWHCDKDFLDSSLTAPVYTSYKAKRTNTFAQKIKRFLHS